MNLMPSGIILEGSFNYATIEELEATRNLLSAGYFHFLRSPYFHEIASFPLFELQAGDGRLKRHYQWCRSPHKLLVSLWVRPLGPR